MVWAAGAGPGVVLVPRSRFHRACQPELVKG